MIDFNSRRVLLATAAAVILIAGGGGVLIGRTLLAPDAAAPAAEEHEEEEGHGDEGQVAMEPARINAAGIQLSQVTAGGLGAEIITQATVTASPDGQANIAARADGAVVRLFKRLGDPVAAGEPLALLESRDAAAIASDRATASARVVAARQAYQRERRLFDAKISARQDLEAAAAGLAIAEAEARRASSAGAAAGVTSNGRYITVASPVAGRITAAPAVLGSFVTAGTELFRVANPARIEIHAALPSADVKRVSPGDTAVIETPTGDTVTAVVRSVTPGLDAESRSATVVLSLTGGLDGLAPGQSVRARITPRVAAATGEVAVPDEAVQSVEGREVVFVRAAKGFQVRPVTTGARSGGRIVILSGLKPGEVIAGKGAFMLKAELGKSSAEHGH
jgi:membrane fusion protein, heavy metal efflux system